MNALTNPVAEHCEARVGPAVGLRFADCAIAGSAALLRADVIFIETSARLPYGSRVTVLLPPVGAFGEVEVQGIVRWWNPRGIGIQFDRARPREVWALHRLMHGRPHVSLDAHCSPGACATLQ
jgi:hypothetical protein